MNLAWIGKLLSQKFDRLIPEGDELEREVCVHCGLID